MGTWKFAIQQKKKMETLKIKIHVAQYVGKVGISRKQNFPALFHAIVSMDRKHTKIDAQMPICLRGGGDWEDAGAGAGQANGSCKCLKD